MTMDPVLKQVNVGEREIMILIKHIQQQQQQYRRYPLGTYSQEPATVSGAMISKQVNDIVSSMVP